MLELIGKEVNLVSSHFVITGILENDVNGLFTVSIKDGEKILARASFTDAKVSGNTLYVKGVITEQQYRELFNVITKMSSGLGFDITRTSLSLEQLIAKCAIAREGMNLILDWPWKDDKRAKAVDIYRRFFSEVSTESSRNF